MSNACPFCTKVLGEGRKVFLITHNDDNGAWYHPGCADHIQASCPAIRRHEVTHVPATGATEKYYYFTQQALMYPYIESHYGTHISATYMDHTGPATIGTITIKITPVQRMMVINLSDIQQDIERLCGAWFCENRQDFVPGSLIWGAGYRLEQRSGSWYFNQQGHDIHFTVKMDRQGSAARKRQASHDYWSTWQKAND